MVDEFEGQQSFWLDAFWCQPGDIYTHPAILAATQLVESYAERNEKVSGFRALYSPMNALTRLLDAREMLRRLRDEQHWPAEKVRDESEPAVLAAMKDPDLCVPSGGITAINQMLTERYKKWSSARRTELARLHREIDDLAPQDDIAALLVSFLRQDDDGEELQGHIGALLEALGDRRERADAPWTTPETLETVQRAAGRPLDRRRATRRLHAAVQTKCVPSGFCRARRKFCPHDVWHNQTSNAPLVAVRLQSCLQLANGAACTISGRA